VLFYKNYKGAIYTSDTTRGILLGYCSASSLRVRKKF